MTTNYISASSPRLCSILSNSVFDEDIAFAVELASSDSCEEDLRNLLEERAFELDELMWWLAEVEKEQEQEAETGTTDDLCPPCPCGVSVLRERGSSRLRQVDADHHQLLHRGHQLRQDVHHDHLAVRIRRMVCQSSP